MITVLKDEQDDRDGLFAGVEDSRRVRVGMGSFAIAQPGENAVLHTMGVYPCTLIALVNVEGGHALGHFDGSNIHLTGGERDVKEAVQRMLEALGGHDGEHIVLSGTCHEDPRGIHAKITGALEGFCRVEWHRDAEREPDEWYDRGYLFTAAQTLVLYKDTEEGEPSLTWGSSPVSSY